MGGEGVGGAAGDFADPVVGGQVDLTAGRVPSSADEVVITPGLARSAGLEIGDTWTAVLWNWTGVGENRAVPLTVVGIGDVAGAGIGAVVRPRRGAAGLGGSARRGRSVPHRLADPDHRGAGRRRSAAGSPRRRARRADRGPRAAVADPDRGAGRGPRCGVPPDRDARRGGLRGVPAPAAAGARAAVGSGGRARGPHARGPRLGDPAGRDRCAPGLRGAVDGPGRRSSGARVAVRWSVGTRAADGAGHRARAHRGAPRGGCRERRARPDGRAASRWPRPCALATPRTWGWTPRAAGWTGSPSDRRSRGWR